MAKNSTSFVCQSCGHRHPKWVGKCENCGTWNGLSEEVSSSLQSGPLTVPKGRAVSYVSLQQREGDMARWLTHIGELDRVLGGGLVPGSVVLIGGDPGIGKSTLLLQALAHISQDRPVVYFSGEESIDQIQRRAHRLGLQHASVQLATETNASHIISTLEKDRHSQIVVIDSIQTLYTDALESATGTVSQVRTCAQLLTQQVKKSGMVLILVGHVTKEGTLAGPKVLEHMVDTVLYFEGERGHPFRILRAVKNRFGPCNEIGVFEMSMAGLQEVANPSALFLGDRTEPVDGAAVFAGMEGSRPLLVEVQALIAPCPYGAPRRSVVGWDPARLNMLLAVLETRCGLSFANKEVYLNISGGLKIQDPALDLAAAASLISALSGTPLSPHTVFCGEISLSGDVRPVSALDMRIKESARLGFSKAMTPPWRGLQGNPASRDLSDEFSNFEVFHVKYVHDLVNSLGKEC